MNEDKLRNLLKQRQVSVTKPRLAVFNVLKHMEYPVSVADLSKKMKDVDKVSVYRTIDLFEKVGIVHRIWTGFKSKIELSEEFSSHHHHFTCLKCGATTSLKSEDLENSLRMFESIHGFRLVQHSVELSGYCKNCTT